MLEIPYKRFSPKDAYIDSLLRAGLIKQNQTLVHRQIYELTQEQLAKNIEQEEQEEQEEKEEKKRQERKSRTFQSSPNSKLADLISVRRSSKATISFLYQEQNNIDMMYQQGLFFTLAMSEDDAEMWRHLYKVWERQTLKKGVKSKHENKDENKHEYARSQMIRMIQSLTDQFGKKNCDKILSLPEVALYLPPLDPLADLVTQTDETSEEGVTREEFEVCDKQIQGLEEELAKNFPSFVCEQILEFLETCCFLYYCSLCLAPQKRWLSTALPTSGEVPLCLGCDEKMNSFPYTRKMFQQNLEMRKSGQSSAEAEGEGEDGVELEEEDLTGAFW